MSQEISLESFDAQLVATMEEAEAQPDPGTPFRIALLGDWSGRSNRGLFASGAELAHWRPVLVDCDNLDEVMAKLGVRLSLSLSNAGNSPLTLDFNKLDHFHPDSISQRAELFQALRETRAQLRDRKTFAQAAEKVRNWANLPAPEAAITESEQRQHLAAIDEKASGRSLLDQVLETSNEQATPAPRAAADNSSSEITALVREAVRPYLLPDDSEQGPLIAAVDRAMGEQMQAILHNPDFQALEAAWRALDFVVSGLETGTELKLYLLDISRAEMEADLLTDEQVQASGIYRLLVDSTGETFGGQPWALLAGNYFFDFTSPDAELLKRLSIVAHDARAPFVAAATSRVIGCESLSATPDAHDWKFTSDARTQSDWEALRKLATTRHLGLALPRFLLRLPYGKETEPVEAFDFEELSASDGPTHESYLWANPVFAVAFLLARAFLQSGWDLRPGELQEIEGLPIHVYKEGGETRIKPCAEVLLTMRAAEKIIARGPMPLLTMKDTGTVCLGMLQSLALPATRLAGRWGE
jgi:type VI secretion system protein ImpC